KQLKTAGEPAEVHLRGDDVLFKCQICGTLYMGPPLGHVRDPEKQSRFVEAELTSLLQAAGGTLPVIKKNERGVYVIVEPEGAGPEHATAAVTVVDSSPEADAHRSAAEAQAATGAPSAAPLSKAAATASPVAGAETPADLAPESVAPATQPTPTASDAPSGEPNRSLMRRGTYAGVVDKIGRAHV